LPSFQRLCGAAMVGISRISSAVEDAGIDDQRGDRPSS
jgi:hypothetical protein